MQRSRREFLEDLGNGMLIAGLGASIAGDLGISAAFADDETGSLEFGKLDRLVGMMQETPAHKLQPILVGKLKSGSTSLKDLIAAAALANAETFGGEDYVGFHTEMALLPALRMAKELPRERQPLPVLKVLYRNTERIQNVGGAKKKTLRPVKPGPLPASGPGGKVLRDATRAADMQRAEQIFAAQVQHDQKKAYNSLLWAVQDNSNVHRFVLAHRAWELISVVGRDHAHTLLRQCVRYCVDREKSEIKRRRERNLPENPIRKLIVRNLERYKLLDRQPGNKQPDDAWLDTMSKFIHSHNGTESMDAVAAALAEGIAPNAVADAIALAANLLVLRQDRLSNGSWRAHGATPGVHSSDATNAWRHMVALSDRRNAAVGLLVAAYNTGGSRSYREVEPYPLEAHRKLIKRSDAAGLLKQAESAIRKNDQGRAAAAIQIYGENGHHEGPVFNLMLKYGISEDGRLHAEKYYNTVREEFAVSRKAFRWRHLIGLARVTASAYGFDVDDQPGHRAPGYEQACRLIGVKP